MIKRGSAEGNDTGTIGSIPRSEVGGAAFFDLGSSLLAGSASISLAMGAVRAGFISKREMLSGLKDGIPFLRKGASDERTAQVRDRILRIVKGRSRDEVLSLADGFMKKLVDDVRPVAAGLLREHEALGNQRVVVSAGPTEVVAQLAAELDLEYGIGTTASVDESGIYTGELDGPFCHREGKAQKMEAMASAHGWDLSSCFAYAGSMSSLPMLQAVGHPVVVEPGQQLKTLAKRKGWPIVEVEGEPTQAIKHDPLRSRHPRPAVLRFSV